LLPTYGRYTRPAILHDYLCCLSSRGEFQRVQADGLFRKSMRELDVAFLKRWLMWAAVRIGSVRQFGPRQLFSPWYNSIALVFLGVFALTYLIIPVVVIEVALLIFVVVEWILYPFVSVGRRGSNKPKLTWKL
jgi:hypothetical protein